MGEWCQSPIGYLEPYNTVCELCGQLVPGRYWRESVGGAERIFCSPDHAEKYETYWIPQYGQTGADA